MKIASVYSANPLFGKADAAIVANKTSVEGIKPRQPIKTDNFKAIPFDEMVAGIEQFLSARRKALQKGVVDKAIIVAKQSGNPLYEAAQDSIDDIVSNHSALFSQRPVLYVHQSPVEGLAGVSGDKHMGAAAVFPDIVETSHKMLEAFKEAPKRIRALLAHELGHTVNGDNTPVRLAENAKQRPSHHNEVRANMMGAILHGNIKDFMSLRIEQAEGSLTHPSTKDWQQQMETWLAYLEKIGAVDLSGKVIDFPKAHTAFKKSRLVPTGQGNSLSIVFNK